MDLPRKRPRTDCYVPPDEEPYDLVALEQDRYRNDLRLKSRWEEIFQKYGKDFGDAADEIDLTTGEIVVNNGHVAGMRDEQDVGEYTHDLLQSFTEGITEEESVEEEELDEGESEDEEENEDGLATPRPNEQLPMSSTNMTHASNTTDDSDVVLEDSERPDLPALGQQVNTEDDAEEMPQDSQALVRSQDPNGRGVPVMRGPDMRALETLQRSIANAVMQFVSQFRSQPMTTESDVWMAPPLPINARSSPSISTATNTPTHQRRGSPVRSDSLWAIPKRGRKRSDRSTRTEAHQSISGGSSTWAWGNGPEGDTRGAAGASTSGNAPNIKRPLDGGRSAKRPAHAFSASEITLMLKLKETDGLSWPEIGKHFPHLPVHTLCNFYYKKICAKQIDLDNLTSKETVSTLQAPAEADQNDEAPYDERVRIDERPPQDKDEEKPGDGNEGVSAPGEDIAGEGEITVPDSTETAQLDPAPQEPNDEPLLPPPPPPPPDAKSTQSTPKPQTFKAPQTLRTESQERQTPRRLAPRISAAQAPDSNPDGSDDDDLHTLEPTIKRPIATPIPSASRTVKRAKATTTDPKKQTSTANSLASASASHRASQPSPRDAREPSAAFDSTSRRRKRRTLLSAEVHSSPLSRRSVVAASSASRRKTAAVDEATRTPSKNPRERPRAASPSANDDDDSVDELA